MGHQDKKIPKKTDNSGQKRQELKTHTYIHTIDKNKDIQYMNNTTKVKTKRTYIL